MSYLADLVGAIVLGVMFASVALLLLVPSLYGTRHIWGPPYVGLRKLYRERFEEAEERRRRRDEPRI